MNPIKKLYQKLLGSSGKPEETAKDDNDLNPDEDSTCYLFFEVENEGIIKMSSYWDGTAWSISCFSELLFALCSGRMTANIFEFLNDQCAEENNEVFLEIVTQYTKLLESGIKDLSQYSPEGSPLVKPSEISKKNVNPFDIN